MRITEQIKRAINADTYISGLLPVKNGRALCPFHGEKTPSLRVHKDYFKCFGCGAGGDVITFASKYHQISLGSAIRMLARESGVNLSHQERPHPYDEAKAERLRAESVEWRRVTRWAMVTADDYESSVPFIEDLDAMTQQELLDAYIEQRTPEQAAALRESARQHAIPTIESLVMEFLIWSR